MMPTHAVIRAEQPEQVRATFELSNKQALRCLNFARDLTYMSPAESISIVVDGFKWEYAI